MKIKMNEMMIIYKNQLNKIKNEIILLKLEIKNKENEMEETKTIIQKLQKERSDLIREKDVIDIFRLTETRERNRLERE
jgi:hypothetical protein